MRLHDTSSAIGIASMAASLHADCAKYYNGARTHLSLEKDAPISRAVDRAGHILCRPTLGGLHHQYARI